MLLAHEKVKPNNWNVLFRLLVSLMCDFFKITKLSLKNTGCPKSSCANVRAYCSAAIGPMRIIRSGMSCIFHSFEESIKWNIKIVHF